MELMGIDTAEGTVFSGYARKLTEQNVYDFSGGPRTDPEWPHKTIHTSTEFAQNCGLRERMASGAMFEAYLVDLLIDLFGEEWLHYGSIRLTFIFPAGPGDMLTPKAAVQSMQQMDFGVRFVMDVWCENQRGDRTC